MVATSGAAITAPMLAPLVKIPAGEGPFVGRKPLGHDFHSARIVARLSQTEHEAIETEAPDSRDRRCQNVCKRPEGNRNRKAGAAADPVKKLPGQELTESVRQ